MKNSGNLEDRILIRELYGQYASGGSIGDRDSWLACWDGECDWTTTNFELYGKAQVRDQWDLMWETFTSAAVFNDVGPIQVSGDSATASCSVLEIIQLKNGGTLKMTGLYSDELVRKNGEWLFRSRKYSRVSEEMTQ